MHVPEPSRLLTVPPLAPESDDIVIPLRGQQLVLLCLTELVTPQGPDKFRPPGGASFPAETGRRRRHPASPRDIPS